MIFRRLVTNSATTSLKVHLKERLDEEHDKIPKKKQKMGNEIFRHTVSKTMQFQSYLLEFDIQTGTLRLIALLLGFFYELVMVLLHFDEFVC